MSKKYTIRMGWGEHQNLSDCHFWMAGSKRVEIQTLCGFATAPYFECRDPEDKQSKCVRCEAALKVAP